MSEGLGNEIEASEGLGNQIEVEAAGAAVDLCSVARRGLSVRDAYELSF